MKTKTFLVVLTVVISSEERPENTFQTFVEDCFKRFQYKSMITSLRSTKCTVTEVPNE